MTKIKTLSEKVVKKESDAIKAVTYFVLPGKITIEGTEYITYGIGAIVDGIMVDSIADISPNLEDVQKIALLFGKCELSIVHLRDAVEDLLE